MSDFSDREKGFERKFVMDEEVRFRATARRNRMLGLWAAEKLGKSGADADAYAQEVVHVDFEEAGDHDVLRKVKADLEAAGVPQSGRPESFGPGLPASVPASLVGLTPPHATRHTKMKSSGARADLIVALPGLEPGRGVSRSGF